jgi:short-subunit dehydrogenase
MEIQGSVAVVTGASSGIGRATALALAKRGAHVVVAARREEKLRELESFIEKSGGKATAVACDVTLPEDIRRLAAVVKEAFGRCDILVNNAGMPAGGPFEDLTHERIDQIVATNVTSVLHATKAFLPMMLRRRRGHVINIASLAGRHAIPGAAIYSATKHAVAAFSESLNMTTESEGVLVTSVNPGFAATESFDGEGPRLLRTTPEAIARAVCHAIESGRAPEVSVPGWVSWTWIVPPSLYRAAIRRFTARSG